MRRVIVSHQISIDGVLGSPPPPLVHRRGQYEESPSLDQLLAADDLLLGRKTYGDSPPCGQRSQTAGCGQGGHSQNTLPRGRWDRSHRDATPDQR